METTLKKLRARKALVFFLVLGVGFNAFASNGSNLEEKTTLSLLKVALKGDFSFSNENDIESDQTLKTVKGTITDDTGESLPGVNISVKGKVKGTQTDFDGNYSIDVEDGSVLVFSYIGFETVEKVVGSSTTLNVQLVEDASSLNEVVVIGYGTAKKSDLAGSVAQLKTEAFEEQPITKVEEALQGRVAGVAVSKTSGNPGDDAKIRIRGVNSVSGNNNPQIIVDGIFGGDLGSINPNDISSIEVLKDASATAIYGSRGSNGVILVTTKKGKGKPKINLDYFTSISRLPNKLDYRLSAAEFARNQQNNPLAQRVVTNQEVADLERNGLDAEDELFRSAFTRNLNLSAQGGDERFNMYVSGNYADQEGILITNKYERYSLRANLGMKVNDRLKLGLNIYTSREQNINNPNNLGTFFGGPAVLGLTFDPTVNYRNADGSYQFDNFRTRPAFGNQEVVPFQVLLRRSTIETLENRTNATANISYDISDSVTVSTVVGSQIINNSSEVFAIQSGRILDDTTTQNGRTIDNVRAVNGNDVASFGSSNTEIFQITNSINWSQLFGKHSVNLTGVHEYQFVKSKNQGFNILNVSENIPLDAPVLAVSEARAADLRVGSGEGSSAIQSFLGRVQYDFNKSLYLTASIRADQSSRFLGDNQTAYFPSAAVAYSIKNLNFIENSDVFNDVKVRASWGRVGNQEIPLAAVFGQVSPVYNASTERYGLVPQILGNPDIVWETTEQWDAGLDVSFFNNRLNLTFDYYEKETTDLLFSTFASIQEQRFARFENVGEIQNKGFELSVYGDVIDNDNFTWTSGIALSHVKNEVVDLFDDLDALPAFINSGDNTGFLAQVQKGQPLGQFLGGINTGEVDDSGNAIYDFSNQSIGNGTPTYTWGFNNTLKYKNLDLNIFFTGANGFDVYNILRASIEGGGPNFRNNLSSNTDVPVGNQFDSARYIEKGDFIRLSNLSLGYTLDNPLKFVSSAKFTVSGQNLFVITDYTGYDPEISSGTGGAGGDVAPGVDRGGIPSPRVITMGVKLDF